MAKAVKFPIMKWAVDTPIHDAIMQAMGAASICWEHPERAGQFNSDRAAAVGEELIDLLKMKLWADGADEA